MAVKVSDLATESAPATTDILLIADPTTGLAKKITVSALKTYMDGLGGGGDTTAPIIVSATATSGSTVVIVFSESVTVTTSGWSFKLNGANWVINSLAGSGATWTFTMATSAISTDTILRSYNSATGGTVDSSANELVTFTDQAVTNNVPSNQLATPTLTATVINFARIDLSWTNVANESSYLLEWSANGTSGWTQIGGTISANTTTYSHTSLTASTLYYYRVKAVGDGVTFSDSGYGTDSDTTSAVDADAQALFTAATTDEAKKVAINQFFVDVKATTGLYAAIRAGYLLINGSLTKDKFNIKNPLDTDGAFRLTASSSTHTATGATGTLKTQFISNASGWTVTSLGISFYNETDAPMYGIQMGVGDGTTNGIGIVPDDSGFSRAGVQAWNWMSWAVTDSRGFFTVTYDGGADFEYAYLNGVQQATISTIDYPLYNAMCLINAQGSDATGTAYLPSTDKTSFAFIHDHLTAAQVLGLSNAVAALRTALGGF